MADTWYCGPSERTLARAASTTSEGLCEGAPAALWFRHLARSPHLSTSTSNDVLPPKRLTISRNLKNILRSEHLLDMDSWNTTVCLVLSNYFVNYDLCSAIALHPRVSAT